MHFRTVVAAGALLLAGFTSAANYPSDTYLPKNYVRGECAIPCGTITTDSVRCGNAPMTCICDSAHAQINVPDCAKCALNYKNDAYYKEFVQKVEKLQNTCGFPMSKKKYSAASGLTCPAIGAGVVAAAAAYAAF